MAEYYLCLINSNKPDPRNVKYDHSGFGVPKELVSDHGSHIQNKMVDELESKLGFRHEYASPYYPQANGQVEVINKVLKTMLKRTVDKHKSN